MQACLHESYSKREVGQQRTYVSPEVRNATPYSAQKKRAIFALNGSFAASNPDLGIDSVRKADSPLCPGESSLVRPPFRVSPLTGWLWRLHLFNLSLAILGVVLLNSFRTIHDRLAPLNMRHAIC
jgi:hypothetical protein